jgi:hypothetical protein
MDNFFKDTKITEQANENRRYEVTRSHYAHYLVFTLFEDDWFQCVGKAGLLIDIRALEERNAMHWEYSAEWKQVDFRMNGYAASRDEAVHLALKALSNAGADLDNLDLTNKPEYDIAFFERDGDIWALVEEELFSAEDLQADNYDNMIAKADAWLNDSNDE